MAQGIFINCTKTAPCPICGGTDWCSWFQGDRGYLLSCKRACRDMYNKQDLCGRDGKMYRFISDKNCQYIYEEAGQHDAGRRKYAGAGKPPVPRKIKYVDRVEPAEDGILDVVYRSLLSKLVLEDRHYEYLRKEGWTDGMIRESMIKSFPENDYARSNGYVPKPYKSSNPTHMQLAGDILDELGISSLKGVPGAYYKPDIDAWTFTGCSGLAMPVYNVDGQIKRLRIRMDYMGIKKCRMKNGFPSFKENGEDIYLDMSGPFLIKDGAKERIKLESFSGKVRPFQSFYADTALKEKGIIKNTYMYGCESKNHCSIYCNSGNNMELCIITEGEKKGQYSNFKLNVPVISLPGVNSYMLLFEKDGSGRCLLDYMAGKGVRIFAVAFDADRNTNAAVMAYYNALLDRLVENGYAAAGTEWSMELGKGLDDLLAKGGFPQFIML